MTPTRYDSTPTGHSIAAITEGIDGLRGYTRGLDALADALVVLAADSRDLDTVRENLLGIAGGSADRADALRVLSLIVASLGDPADTPSLTELDSPRATEVHEHTAQWADYDADFPPRELVMEAVACADPLCPLPPEPLTGTTGPHTH